MKKNNINTHVTPAIRRPGSSPRASLDSGLRPLSDEIGRGTSSPMLGRRSDGHRWIQTAVLFSFLGLLWGCGSVEGVDVNYNPSEQLLPHHIQKIALHPVVNQTKQFGISSKLSISIRDAFLRNGNYSIVPDNDPQAQGIVETYITRYILTPLTFNQNLTPVTYQLLMLMDIKFVDIKTNTILWDQPNIQSIVTYTDAAIPGGITEEQAREEIYPQFADDVVKRVVHGFGTVMGEASRVITSTAPSTAPNVEPTSTFTAPTKPY